MYLKKFKMTAICINQRLLYVFFSLLLINIALSSCSPPSATDQQDAVFEIKRGTNVAHWLSQSNRRGIDRDTFFTAGDVERIAAFGFDHIRLPVDEEQLWKENGE